MEKNEQPNITEHKTTKRVGTFTFGLTLVLFGICIIVQTIFPFDMVKILLLLWPITFISIGIETIYYLTKKDIQIKYDFLGIILTLFLLFIGGVFSAINYGVNKILYSEPVQDGIISLATEPRYDYGYEDSCNIINLSNKKVTVSIVENDKIQNSIYIQKNFAENENTNDFIYKLITQTSHNDNIGIDYTKDTLTICITHLPEYIDSINLFVYTNNIENLYIENCEILR